MQIDAMMFFASSKGKTTMLISYASLLLRSSSISFPTSSANCAFVIFRIAMSPSSAPGPYVRLRSSSLACLASEKVRSFASVAGFTASICSAHARERCACARRLSSLCPSFVGSYVRRTGDCDTSARTSKPGSASESRSRWNATVSAVLYSSVGAFHTILSTSSLLRSGKSFTRASNFDLNVSGLHSIRFGARVNRRAASSSGTMAASDASRSATTFTLRGISLSDCEACLIILSTCARLSPASIHSWRTPGIQSASTEVEEEAPVRVNLSCATDDARTEVTQRCRNDDRRQPCLEMFRRSEDDAIYS
mmetsp:Transcript_20029/g.65272  ORF Transcript_20029/g.65272 Transcript_20029/m.65272 type:complete len:308 (+) Transcript_20029:13-936(+)